MDGGGPCVITPLIKPMLMWRVDSWDLIQPPSMGMHIPWGRLLMAYCMLLSRIVYFNRHQWDGVDRNNTTLLSLRSKAASLN